MVAYSAGATEEILKHYPMMQPMLELACWEMLLIRQTGLISEAYERMASTIITSDDFILRLSILFLQLEITIF